MQDDLSVHDRLAQFPHPGCSARMSMEDTVPGVPGTLPDTLLESGTPPAATPSAASAYSADAAWGLVSADTPQARSPLASTGSLSANSGGVPLTGKELHDLVCKAVDSVYSKHGGPFST